MATDCDSRCRSTFGVGFEQGTGIEFPSVQRLPAWQARSFGEHLLGGGVHVNRGYIGEVSVPHYEHRTVIVLMCGDTPHVFADGPGDSPHRYSSGSLCMWFNEAPTNRRWLPEDGLADLLFRTRNHLFREAWWRERGEWLGDEHPHEAVSPPQEQRDVQ